MQIVVEVENKKVKQFIDLLQSLDYVEVKNVKEKDFKKFAGMWKSRNISLETIREKAWKK